MGARARQGGRGGSQGERPRVAHRVNSRAFLYRALCSPMSSSSVRATSRCSTRSVGRLRVSAFGQ